MTASATAALPTASASARPKIGAAFGERRNHDQERDHREILEQQDAHHVAAVRRVRAPCARPASSRRSRSSSSPARRRARVRRASPSRSRCSASIATPVVIATCAKPEAEHRAAHRLQLRQAEFEADREHQEDDRRIRRGLRTSALSGTHASACGPTAMPTDQVAEDRRQAHEPAERPRRRPPPRAGSGSVAVSGTSNRNGTDMSGNSRVAGLVDCSTPASVILFACPCPSRASAPAARRPVSMPTVRSLWAATCSRPRRRAIDALADRLGDFVSRRVPPPARPRGRVVVTGIGKSGHIARKLAATLASTGTPAFFVHAAEASHGDLGMITADDVVLLLSNSGETDELVSLLPHLKRQGARLIALTGNDASSLAQAADVHLDASVDAEAVPARPRAHREHDRRAGARRCARAGAARRARFFGRGLRALASGRRARAPTADTRARRHAQRRRGSRRPATMRRSPTRSSR